MLCICLKSGQFAITAVLQVATKGHKQCWQRPAASLENHRGRNINYINRYINSHSAYLYRYQQCITVVYSYATHVRVQFMNMKYIIKSHRLCKSEAMLLCVFCENGFTILNVEYSERYVPVWLCLLKWAHSSGFYLLPVSREPDVTQNTAGSNVKGHRARFKHSNGFLKSFKSFFFFKHLSVVVFNSKTCSNQQRKLPSQEHSPIVHMNEL